MNGSILLSMFFIINGKSVRLVLWIDESGFENKEDGAVYEDGLLIR